MNSLEQFLKQLADREEEFGDLHIAQIIRNEILPNLHHYSPKQLANVFYDEYDKRRMG